jgi:hypothetical protein
VQALVFLGKSIQLSARITECSKTANDRIIETRRRQEEDDEDEDEEKKP